MAFNSNPTVDDLVAAGRYADAAAWAEKHGEAARAAELYERIWEFLAAARCARAAGDLERALKNAIDARAEDTVREIAVALGEAGETGRRAALEVFAGKRRFAEAAQLAEQIGERDRAIDYYLSSHRDLDAARLLALVGRDREAGQLYERVVEQSATPGEVARAHLRLGQLLARRLQHDQAVRHLQEAARQASCRVEARRALVVELAALGLRDSARDVLLSARAEDPSLPVALDDYLRAAAVAAPRAVDPSDLVAGRYRLDHLLGHGATGRVYRATDEVSGRQVAVKILAAGHARGSPPYERFAREAEVASSLRHPNLVEVFDFSPDFGFLVMEYMVGGSLDERAERRMGPGAVRRLATDVLSGLEAAHRRGVIHRDIKPANIFFDARGTAKLGDFGVAHLLELGQTQTGGLIGTLAYMSPEQITGAPLGVSADLYSFGVMLFEVLTGRLPFLGPDFVAQHLGDAPPAAGEVAPDLAPGWDPVLARLLAKDPGERHQGVDALRREIAAVDLGAAGRPAALLLPRAAPSSAAESSRAIPVQDDDDEDLPRYRFETPLGRTPISSLSRAVDATLDRSVIIERYDQGALDRLTERRLLALARSGGAFLQRILAYDRSAAVVVFEAPSGKPIGELQRGSPEASADVPAAPSGMSPPSYPGSAVGHRTGDAPALDPLRAVRALKCLARAVAPLHHGGAAHGALGPTTVVVDELDHPTVLASGLGAAPPAASPDADVAALVALVGQLCGAGRDTGSLIDTLAAGLSHPERSALRLLPASESGQGLHQLAEALEIALLKMARRERKAG